ncbi:MAG: fumarylacetoacetate hydrolase family protein [Tepidisphaerales bacterium]
MKLCRYESADGSVRWGELISDSKAVPLTGVPWGGEGVVRPAGPAETVRRLLAPVEPPAIFCIGLNYREHARETGAAIPTHPVVFMKQPGAIQHPGEPIILPRGLASQQVDFEGELVVVIGRRCKNVQPSAAASVIYGYTCGNDVSARDWQKQWGGGQFCRGKTFDTFAPVGPVVVSADELGDPQALPITTRVNGKEMQKDSTGGMIFSVAELVAFLSGSTTLYPGTLIFTGTPSGVGMARQPPVYLKAGDRVEVEIGGIGVLVNPVVEESVASV